jgi:hypothetical protein
VRKVAQHCVVKSSKTSLLGRRQFDRDLKRAEFPKRAAYMVQLGLELRGFRRQCRACRIVAKLLKRRAQQLLAVGCVSGSAVSMHKHQRLAPGEAVTAYALQQGILVIVVDSCERAGQSRTDRAPGQPVFGSF